MKPKEDRIGVRSRRWALFCPVLVVMLIQIGCASGEPALTATPAVSPGPQAHEEEAGQDLYIAKGCSGCHGQDAQGTSIAPALAGHTEQMVKRQVRTPRFRMPAFGEQQVSDDELEAIARFIAGLEGEGHLHAEVPSSELTAAVEMHHWMALEALKAGSSEDAIHHVEHIIELLAEGEHRNRMETILVSLRAGETHDPEHDIEEMVAGTAVPGLTLAELHLRQALVALAVGDVADAQHHVLHLQETASPEELERGAEVLDSLERGDLHNAEHDIRELLGQEEHRD